MPFHDKYFQTQIDFCLPYDLWDTYVNGKLFGQNAVQCWNFKEIRKNIYSDCVKSIQSPDLPQCSCKPEYECSENCLNRLVYTECNPKTCQCGDKCQNTKIQKQMVAPVERFMTQNKGWGVRTNHLITKDSFILEYIGEVITESEFRKRMTTLYTSDVHHYCLNLGDGLVIDGHRIGCVCRFVNHSCQPNCEIQNWSVNGLSRMCLFAIRDIHPGEELTYDYNFSLYNPDEGQVCKCESNICRGVIGSKSQFVRPINTVNMHHALLKQINFILIFIHSMAAIEWQSNKFLIICQQNGGSINKKKKDRLNNFNRSGVSKSKGFIHSKDDSRRSLLQLPGAKEQMLIVAGHCFLLRNLKKVTD